MASIGCLIVFWTLPRIDAPVRAPPHWIPLIGAPAPLSLALTLSYERLRIGYSSLALPHHFPSHRRSRSSDSALDPPHRRSRTTLPHIDAPVLLTPHWIPLIGAPAPLSLTSTLPYEQLRIGYPSSALPHHSPSHRRSPIIALASTFPYCRPTVPRRFRLDYSSQDQGADENWQTKPSLLFSPAKSISP